MKSKTPCIAFLGMALILLMGRMGWGADVVGGYIDTVSAVAVVQFADGVTAAATGAELKLGKGGWGRGRGDLHVVDPFRGHGISKKGFRDQAGRFVSPPADGFDKVVLLDRSGEIFALVGASAGEANAVLQGMGIDLKWLFDSPTGMMEGLLDAAAVLQEAGSLEEEEKREIFLATVALRAGKAAQQVVEGIMKAAASGDEMGRDVAALLGIGETAAEPSSLEGIGVVAQGGDGDGGTSTVAQGGDGDGGTSTVAQGGDGDGGTSLVAQGGDGDGGTSLVAQGGDGDGGTSLVAQGGDGDGGTSLVGVVVHGGQIQAAIDLIVGTKINATCRGTLILIE